MKLNSIQNNKKIDENITMRDLIIQQKGSNYGTTALNSIILNKIDHENKQVSVTVQRQDSDFDKVIKNPAKRRSFLGRVNDNLTQLFPNYQIDVLWLSGFDSDYHYLLNKTKD